MRKFALLALSIFMILSIAGCGGGEKATDVGKAKVPQVVRYNVSAEPETLDPAMSTGMIEATIITNMFEGLVRYGADNKIIPGVAKDWTISPDGLVYTFKLRESKWSNGDNLTAGDFVYAWLRALDPKKAAEYAYQFYYIKGAEEYNSGEGKAEDVAVKALDALTLEVTLRSPAPQFLGLTAFPALYPINSKVEKENPEWFKSVEKYIANGPFKPVKWEHNQKMELVKNEAYWDAGNVKLEKLDIYLIDDIETGYTMYQTGELDFQDEVPIQEMAQLKAKNEVQVFTDSSVYFYRFNVTKEPFNDVKVRKALAMSINRQDIVEKVRQAGELPAFAYVPFGFPDSDGKDFRQNAGNEYFKEDVAEAKRLMAEAGYPEGKGFPKVSIGMNVNTNHEKVGQAIQQMWKQNLGIDVELSKQEWQVYLDSQDNLNYSISRSGWSPDYLDPMSFVDMFVTNGGNNDTGWSNKEYDALVAKANSTGEQKIRMDSMHQAEKILMDEMPIMPLYFYTNPNLIKPNLKGVIVPPFALYADFKNAYME